LKVKDRVFWSQKAIKFSPIIGLTTLIILLIYTRQSGMFHSVTDLQNFIKNFGSFAIAVFIVVQSIQPTIPFLPGGIATIAGMMMFGNISGIIYSYIGLVIGEIGLFLLVRKFGPKFAQLVLSEKNYLKFELGMKNQTKNIKALLIICFIFPFLPDDLTCLVAGMTDLSFHQYLKIVLIFKLWSVIAYGYFCLFVLNKTISML